MLYSKKYLEKINNKKMDNEKQLKKMMTDYVLMRDLLDKKGGPEKDAKLFEKVIYLEDEILKKFGLPSIREYSEVLWNLQINSESDLKKAITFLSNKAKTYLSKPVVNLIALINNAKAQKIEAYDFLKEIGISTHEYTIWICSLFYSDKISAEDAIKELILCKKPSLLGKASLVSNENHPEKSKFYKELKNTGLNYIDDFIIFKRPSENKFRTIIDCHVHAFNKQEIEDLQKSMKENNISASIILYWPLEQQKTPPLKNVIKNIEKYNNLFVAGSIKITDNKNFKKDLKEIEDLIIKKKIIALKLYPGYEYFYVNDEKCNDLYSLCNKYKIPVMFHCGDTWSSYKKAIIHYSNPMFIEEIAVKFPNLKILICHIGNPCWIDETKELIYKNKNVYTDISGILSGNNNWYIVSYNENIMNKLHDMIAYVGGAHKILFGTDFDIFKQSDYVNFINAFIEKYPILQNDIDNMTHKNAIKFFNLPDNMLKISK